MGDVKRLLYSKPLAHAAPDHYADKATWETAESLHMHRRNIRLEMSKLEFQVFLEALGLAHDRWVGELGRPDPFVGAATKYLFVGDLPPVSEVSPRRFEVEECRYATIPEGTIHLHYRDWRLEMSPEEWIEYSGGIIEARREWDRTR